MATPLHSAIGRWVPPGEPTEVGGHAIPGGLFYRGRQLPGASGPVEPSLVDPDLPVASSPGRHSLPGGGQNPAYHLLSPFTRKAYLVWLAGGRRSDVAPGLVRLFCFGLERRILVDGDVDPAVQRELPAIAAEVRRLRVRYGDTTALRETLDHLLDLLGLLTAERTVPGAEPDRESPTAVKIALARFAVSSTPLPAVWARAWTRHHPSLGPRRSEIDCPAEFDKLFTMRYRERYGRGVVAPGDGAGIRLRYRPSHPGLATALVWRADLPDLLVDNNSIRALAALRDETAADLDPYRRWLARFPQGRDSLAAVPLLPAELVDARHGRLGALRVWAERRLDGRARVMVDGGEFWDFWSAADPHRMATDETTALLSVLARLDLGVEPDVRFGAPPLARGPAALFRLGRPAAGGPGPRFASAAAIVRCAVAVASAAGPVDPQGLAGAAMVGTVADLAAALRLTPGEDLRLAARLSWLLTTRVEVDRLARQTAVTTPAEREVAGHYLATVAVTADPVIGPATVAVLTRVYRILGLPVDLVFQRLHERGTGVVPSLPLAASAEELPPPVRRRASAAGAEQPDEPVVVQAGDHRPTGYALPWAAAAEPAPAGFRLDHALVQRKAAESDTAAALLNTIFDEEETGYANPQPPCPVREQPAVAGLDRMHGALLHALGERPAWSRAEFDALAAAHGVLPDGALDVLNEAAIDVTGAPVLEGDTMLAVADDVLLELLT
ncbi:MULTISPECIES: TerB N-terminal domain-containing protein [unclassified Micromonospora]|uniref:TerB N-terminal domain-containing protein n=1 Tax=unclassified Micromonospora TaxID=2617518 RepID=UPI0036402680